MKTETEYWPEENKKFGMIREEKLVCEVETGKIISKEFTGRTFTRKEWQAKGFSFNGKLSAKAT